MKTPSILNKIKFPVVKRKQAHENQHEFTYKSPVNGDEIPFDTQLKIDQQKIKMDCKEKGRLLAQSIPIEPMADSLVPHGFEKEMESLFQSKIYELKKFTTDKLSEQSKKLNRLKKKLSEFIKRKVEAKQQISESIKQKRKIETDNTNKTYLEKEKNLKQELSNAESELKNLDNNIRDIDNQLQKDHEASPSKKRKYLLLVILLLIGILDFPMSYRVLVSWREDLFSTLLLATLFAIIIPASAHCFGSYLKKRTISLKDYCWVVVSLFASIFISWFVGHVRHSYLIESTGESFSAFSYGALNFLLFIIGAFLSYHMSARNPELIKQLFTYQNRLNEAKESIRQFKQKLIELDNWLASKKHSIIESFRDDSSERIEDVVSDLENKICVSEKEFDSVFTAVQSTESLISSYYNEAILCFRSSNESWRIDNKTPLYFKDSIPHLNTFFIEKTLDELNGALISKES